MNKSLKIVMGVCLVLLLLFSFLGYFFFHDLAPSQNSNEDEVLLKSSSPDGSYTVEMHRQNGGATVDFAILGKLFIGNSAQSKDFYWSYHESEAKVEWLDNSTVVINGKKVVLPDGEYDWRKEKIEPTIIDKNIETFTSSELGISFQHDENVLVKQIGNRVYVYEEGEQPKLGQFVEVFSKKTDENLEQAIERTIVAKYRTCPGIKAVPYNLHKNDTPTDSSNLYSAAEISREVNDPIYGSIPNSCPKDYAMTNGLRYFLADQLHPNRFIFFQIGQYTLLAGNKPWQTTIKFTKLD